MEEQTYGVWCECDGPSGHQERWLISGEQVFRGTRVEAEAKALKMTESYRKMSGPIPTVFLGYRARPLGPGFRLLLANEG